MTYTGRPRIPSSSHDGTLAFAARSPESIILASMLLSPWPSIHVLSERVCQAALAGSGVEARALAGLPAHQSSWLSMRPSPVIGNAPYV